MIIIHDVSILHRIVGTALVERLKVMPAVVVTGARQTGKSTLAEHLVPGERRCASLDDFEVLDLARRAQRSHARMDHTRHPGGALVASALSHEVLAQARIALSPHTPMLRIDPCDGNPVESNRVLWVRVLDRGLRGRYGAKGG